MTLAARLRKLEAPDRAVTFEAGDGHLSVAYEPDPLWPLLADLAEAAEQVTILEYDPQRSVEENTELLRRATAFRAALDRVAAQLDHEEGTP